MIVGKVYSKFQIDVGLGDAVIGEPEELTGDDLLDFVGISPVRVLAIPKPQQFVEKVHAYTFPWSGRLNTRTKDLVDLVILIERGLPDLEQVRSALRTTFETRGTHPIPRVLPAPPSEWDADFPGMAREGGISTSNYLEAFAIVVRYWSLLDIK